MTSSQGTSPAPPASDQANPIVIAKFKRQMRWLWIHYGVVMGLCFLLPVAYLDGFLWAVIASSAVCTFLFYRCPACSRSLVGTAAPKTCSRCGTALVDVQR